jgi:hypothetical protein
MQLNDLHQMVTQQNAIHRKNHGITGTAGGAKLLEQGSLTKATGKFADLINKIPANKDVHEVLAMCPECNTVEKQEELLFSLVAWNKAPATHRPNDPPCEYWRCGGCPNGANCKTRHDPRDFNEDKKNSKWAVPMGPAAGCRDGQNDAEKQMAKRLQKLEVKQAEIVKKVEK